MTKVSIYYYSRKEFTLKIPKKYTSLSELAREDDLERQEMQHYHHVDGQPREQPDSVLQKKPCCKMKCNKKTRSSAILEFPNSV